MQNIVKEELIIADYIEYYEFGDYKYDDDFDLNRNVKRIKLDNEIIKKEKVEDTIIKAETIEHKKIKCEMHCHKTTQQQNFYIKEEPIIFDLKSANQAIPPAIALRTEPSSSSNSTSTHTYCSGCSRKSAVRVRQARCLDCNGPLSYHCDNCGTSYKSYTSLNYHLRTHHVAEYRVFRCPTCSSQLSTAKILAAHQQYCGKPKLLSCKQCNYTSRYRSTLRDHVKSTHAVKNFQCEKCGKVYGNCKSARRHKAQYCGGEKTFSCEHCLFRAFRKDQLPAHLCQKHPHIFQ